MSQRCPLYTVHVQCRCSTAECRVEERRRGHGLTQSAQLSLESTSDSSTGDIKSDTSGIESELCVYVRICQLFVSLRFCDLQSALSEFGLSPIWNIKLLNLKSAVVKPSSLLVSVNSVEVSLV